MDDVNILIRNTRRKLAMKNRAANGSVIKGQDGKTPVKGVDYMTQEEINIIKKEATPIKGIHYFDGQDGKPGKDGKTPRKGIDYFTKQDIDSIKKDVTPKKGKDYFDGKDGEDGSPDTPEDIKQKLESLKGRERLDAKAIKGLDKMVSVSVSSVGGGNGGVSDGKVKVDASDTADYLENQVEAGSNVTITKNAGKLRIAASGVGGTTNHDELNNLGYTESGHTGFEPARGADDNYVTDSEKSVLTELDTSGIYKDASNVSAIDLENRRLWTETGGGNFVADWSDGSFGVSSPGGYKDSLDASNLTQPRAITLPDKDGTMAMLDDIPAVPSDISELTDTTGIIPTQYTDEMAQDAVGGMIVDTSTIDLTYTDATPELKADVKDNSITEPKLAMNDTPSNGEVIAWNSSGDGYMEWVTPAGGVSDGDKGDITVSGSGATWTLDNSTVTEAKLSLSDVTTANVSTTAHGFVPKAPNNANTYLRGDGTWGYLSLYNQTSTSSGQSVSGANDTYITNSVITVPSGDWEDYLKVGTRLSMELDITKTAAGTAAPAVYIRCGTNGTTSDTSVLSATCMSQTAAIDTGKISINLVCIYVGSGTGAQASFEGELQFFHSLSTTGLQKVPAPVIKISGNIVIDGNTKIGLSINPGSSAAWSVTGMRTYMTNLK